MQADRERWDATTDRVAGTVVELGEQRSELAGTRERLEQLWERFEREPIAFDLQKRSDKQRVGPIWLWLRKTDRKNHRYTMRVFADGIGFVRPLLCVRRDEIIEYLRKRNLKWRDDHTNVDCTYRRNYIRHRLIPRLQHDCSDSIVEQISALAQSARKL